MFLVEVDMFVGYTGRTIIGVTLMSLDIGTIAVHHILSVIPVGTVTLVIGHMIHTSKGHVVSLVTGTN